MPPTGFLALLQRLRTEFAAEVQPLLRARGLAPGTLHLLELVERHPHPTEMARELGMPPATASRLLKALEAGGYVVRATDPADLRRYRFRLTTAGARVRDQAAALVHESVERRLARLDPVERAELERLLQRLLGEGEGGSGG